MNENIFTTVCPGCSIACGMYVREKDDGTFNIDWRKDAVVNAGKLCRFGVRLPANLKAAVSKVDGNEVELSDAVTALGNAIGDGAAFVSVGNTTCEEHLALMKLAESKGAVVNTGMGAFSAISAECHSTMGVGVPLDAIESAKKIVLFIDPYEQYPLLVRRILAGKKNGATVTAVGWKAVSLADDNKTIDPANYESELALDSDSVIIAEINPSTDPERVMVLLNLAKASGAAIMFMKPFVNAVGCDLASKKTEQKSLDQIIAEINDGSIKTLVCLDSDLIEIMPDETAVREALGKLDNLIVITSRASAIADVANIVVATEPFYKKAGTVVNAEGRAVVGSGEGTDGIDAIGVMLGQPADLFAELNSAVLATLGIDAVDERVIPVYEKPEYGVMDANPTAEEVETALVYAGGPFFWNGIVDDNDFVEMNLDMLTANSLLKGIPAKIVSDKGEVVIKYKVSDVAPGVVLSNMKLPMTTGMVTSVTVSR
ncbi:hypothetical protein DRO03_03565 [Methanosarcinales archaeon]|nr:MAG: hypothetical protein DRO03_03565 [Methanosarcinales archaeon]